MSIESEVRVGSIATVKVGRNEVTVTVTAVTEHGWMVESQSTGRQFEVKKLERVITPSGESTNIPEEAPAPETDTVPTEAPEQTEAVPTKIAESETASVPRAEGLGGTTKQPHGLSLLEAAVLILKRSRTPLNTKELITKAVASGLWTPNSGKTPEQSLYSAIFREINGKENPRIRKSAEKKGSFEYIR